MQINLYYIIIIVLAASLGCFSYKYFIEKKNNNYFIKSNYCNQELMDVERKIRHEYNNILQTMICYVEEEDLQLLRDYKNILKDKINSINKNSLIHLSKIKDLENRLIIYNLMEAARQSDISLNITVMNDVNQTGSKEIKIDNELKSYIWNAFENASQNNNEIYLNINLDNRGICFQFKSKLNTDIGKINPAGNRLMKNSVKKKNILTNMFVQDNIFVQEIVKMNNNG